MSVFRELYLHLVWTKNHWFIVHRPFGPSLKRGWDIFVANVTHEKSVTQPLRPGVFHPDGAWTTKTHHFFRCLFVEILTKRDVKFGGFCFDTMFWAQLFEDFSLAMVRLGCYLGCFEEKDQWSPGPKNGSTNKIHHLCVFFLAPSFFEPACNLQVCNCDMIFVPSLVLKPPSRLWCS